jgi:DNA mismatch repair protein MutL
MDAYRSAGAASHNPEVVLLVEVAPALVDVNVHPAKTEVRFADPRAVWIAVERAVRGAISKGARAEAPAVRLRHEDSQAEGPFTRTPIVAEHTQRWLDDTPGLTSTSQVSGTRATLPTASHTASGNATAASGLLVLGQHRRTYLVATDGEDLLLVDQHTAHERIRFESILDRIASRPLDAQGLVAPVVFTVPPTLVSVLEAHLPFLGELGFDVEPFGGREACLRSVPALLRDSDPAERLLAILRDIAEREEASWAVAQGRERIAASLACHSAVRAGQVLRAEEMAEIARGILATRHPTLCPHGRPTLVRIPREDISRWFERIGWKRS